MARKRSRSKSSNSPMASPTEQRTSGYTTPTGQRASGYIPPGRLGDPRIQIQSDPRINPVLLQQLSRVGLDRNREPKSLATINADPSPIDLAVLTAEVEMGFESLYEGLPNDLVSDQVEIETERVDIVIKGGDNQDMLLHIYRPAMRSGHLSCIVYFHGGAMTFIRTVNKVHERWCRSLAAAGLMVVLVGFRNTYKAAAYHPFPAGLNDCATAVNYLYENRDTLEIRNIILQGEDGGANLALATALKAKQEGWIHKIDGVYAIAPYISNAYGSPTSAKLQNLPSLLECYGYLLSINVLYHLAMFYTPKEGDKSNPLAWPYYATIEDMRGLPPHVLVMDELDPLRDEGIAYSRNLAQAGVDVLARLNLGTVHATSVIFRKAMPQVHKSTVSDIAAFARRV